MGREESKSYSVLVGTGISVIFCLVSILIFSFIVKGFGFSSGIIKTVNQFIKSVAIFLGCFLNINGKNGFIKGGLIGLVSSVIMQCFFALIGGSFCSAITFILDAVFCIVIGALFGIISVNAKK